jgi:UDP-N-acetylmuramyl pentapeptide phosphotransferase/UDP-N-acetylglucosamine-1-phosphate transferase
MSSIQLSGSTAVFIAFAAAAFVSWFFLPLVVKVANIRNLTDKPGERKIHKRAIPTLGGIGIFIGFAFGFLLCVDVHMEGLTYFLLSVLLLLFAGISDDLIDISALKKLFAIIFAAVILVAFTDIRLTNFHGFMGIYEIPVWMTAIVTIFAVIVVTNALNLIDGIDGLAASTGIISSLTLAGWFYMQGDFDYSIMGASLAGALIIFMFFNFSTGKNKIFMGDTGSLIIGFILVAMLIRFNETPVNNGVNPLVLSTPAISTAILIVPLFDTLRVFTIRILRKQSPFTADNRHVHHLLLKAGFTHRRATLAISFAHIGIVWMAFRLDYLGIFMLCILLLLVSMLLTGIIYVMIYRKSEARELTVSADSGNSFRLLANIFRLFF